MSKNKFIITDAELIPDELCDVMVTMSAELWRELTEHIYECSHTGEFDGRFYKIMPARVPSNERIRAALQKPCPRCNGEGQTCKITGVPWSQCDCGMCERGPKSTIFCPDCSGTKTASVPGARLEPRGESVVVK